MTAIVATVLSGCSGGSDGDGGGNIPGVTATTVTVGTTVPLTGPASPGYSEIAPAERALFDYVNSNGGIHGRKITLKYLDDAYNPAKSLVLTKQLVLQDKVFAMVGAFGTVTHKKVIDFLNSQRVPDLFVGSGCECWNDPQKYPYTFGWQTNYVVEGKILGQYIAQHFAGKKIAYFAQADDIGPANVEGLDQYVDPGAVVARQTYESGTTDVTAQVAAIARAKPDVVMLSSLPTYTALFTLAALKIGFHPTIVVGGPGSDPVTLSRLLENSAKKAGSTVDGKQLIEGYITDVYLPTRDDASNSWIALFKKIHDRYIPQLPFDRYTIYAMSIAYTFVQALQAAGPNPTRAGVVAAVERGLPSGPGLTPFLYSEDSHAGFSGVQIATINKGAVVRTGPPMITDTGHGPVTPYSAPQATAPADGIPG